MAKQSWLNANAETLALSLLSAGEASHAFSAFLPSRFTIKNWVLCGDEAEVAGNIANLRSGYMPAVLFAVSLAGVVSVIARSVLPLVFSIGTSVVMIKLYEGALPSDMQLRNPFDFLSMGRAPLPKANGQGTTLLNGEAVAGDLGTGGMGL